MSKGYLWAYILIESSPICYTTALIWTSQPTVSNYHRTSILVWRHQVGANITIYFAGSTAEPHHVKPQSHRIVRFLDRTIGCDLANVRPIGNVCYDLQKRGRILWSVFFAGGRSSYDWSYAWSRDQQRLEKIDGKIHHIVGNRTTSGSHKRSIVRSIVAPDDRSYDRSWNSAADSIVMSVSNRFVVPPVVRWHDQFWTWPSTLLRLICPLRSPTTSATSRTTSSTSRTTFLRLAHDYNIFRSQVGRNLVVSPVLLGFEHDHDLAATDLPLAITHDLCDQSYDLRDQSYVLSFYNWATIPIFFGRR